MSTLSITRPLTAANQEIAMPTASVTRKLFKLHWLELTRNRAQFIFAMVFPLFMGGMFFLISTVMPSSTAANFGAMILPMSGYLALSGVALNLTAGPLVQYREQGTFRVLGTTPLSRSRFLLTHLFLRVVFAMVLCAVLYLLGAAIGLADWAAIPALTAASLPALLLFLAIGYWLGGVMTSSQATSSVSAFLQVGFLFISGAGIPMWLLPETVQQVISWLPPALSVDPLFWASNSPFQRHDPWLTSGITIVLAALVMLAAIRTFRWEVRSR